jgi:hypothetical protein
LSVPAPIAGLVLTTIAKAGNRQPSAGADDDLTAPLGA